ncbi:MAG: hypothetical protein Q8P41_17710 [Pseudomonadota bacterium]|nr:hypothetical protein [Pseudomonadota bacterium]
MSSQERWFVILKFQNGPLSFQGEMPLRGPVIRLGANPGPGGLKLEGYRGLDDRQAVLTAYDGGTASVAPVGPNQVRMAPHEHVDWNEVQPIRGPTFLSDGCALHFGPPGRGATAVFIQCRRLGAWEQGAILSDASQLDAEVRPTEVRELDASKRFPLWVIPIALTILTMFVSALGGMLFVFLQRDVDRLGPVDEGQEDFGCRGTTVCQDSLTEKVDVQLYKGVQQAFNAFLMKPNIAAAEWKELENPEKWDKNLMEWVTRSEQMHGKGWTFWRQLDKSREDYAAVLAELRKANLPDVLAAIPFQESRYNARASDPILCAYGYWQFQPEVAKRAGVEVRNCKFRGVTELWSPTRLAPPINVLKNADYVENGKCQIQSCEVDQRSDRRFSTIGAAKLLGEAFSDKELRYSGAITQITIASHNAGYDNSPHQDGRVNVYNMLHAYRKYLQAEKLERAPDFIGRNITCTAARPAENFLDRCGGSLGSVTQHYVPYVISQHLLAVCYYGSNYADEFTVFDSYREFVRANGYCNDIRVPTKEQVAAQGKGK